MSGAEAAEWDCRMRLHNVVKSLLWWWSFSLRKNEMPFCKRDFGDAIPFFHSLMIYCLEASKEEAVVIIIFSVVTVVSFCVFHFVFLCSLELLQEARQPEVQSNYMLVSQVPSDLPSDLPSVFFFFLPSLVEYTNNRHTNKEQIRCLIKYLSWSIIVSETTETTELRRHN